MKCYICNSEKRPVKFCSKRLNICQWCVSFLCDSPVDPDVITKDIYAEAKAQATNLIESEIKSKIPSCSDIRRELITKYNSSFIQNTFWNRVFKSDQLYKQDQYVNDQTNRIIEKAKIEATPIDKEKVIADAFQSILLDIVTRQQPVVVKRQKLVIKNRYYGPSLKVKQIYEKVDAHTLKYFSAIYYSIIAGKNKTTRYNVNDWYDIRTKIRKDDGNKCLICGARYNDTMLHVHHIIPLSKYGSNHTNNLITLCENCHQAVHPDIPFGR